MVLLMLVGVQVQLIKDLSKSASMKFKISVITPTPQTVLLRAYKCLQRYDLKDFKSLNQYNSLFRKRPMIEVHLLFPSLLFYFVMYLNNIICV